MAKAPVNNTAESEKAVKRDNAASSVRPESRAPQKKTNAKSSQKKQKKKELSPKANEIGGIALIAVGLFLGLAHIVPTGIVGAKVLGFVFGLTGVFAYVLPVILIAHGIYTVATAGKRAALSRFMLLVAVSVMVLSFIHVFFEARVEAGGYFDFLWKSFALGETVRSGGGLLGALLSYPSVALLGHAGSYILFPILSLAMLVALTNLSIQKTTEKVGTAIKKNVAAIAEQREQRREKRVERKNTESADNQRKRGFADGDELSVDSGVKKKSRKKDSMDEFDEFFEELNSDAGNARTNARNMETEIAAGRANRGVTHKPDLDVEPVRPSKRSRFNEHPMDELYIENDTNAVDEVALDTEPKSKAPVRELSMSGEEYTQLVLDPKDGRYVSALENESAAKDEADAREETSAGAALAFEEAPEDVPDVAALAERDFGKYEKYLPPLSGRHERKETRDEWREPEPYSEAVRPVVHEPVFEYEPEEPVRASQTKEAPTEREYTPPEPPKKVEQLEITQEGIRPVYVPPPLNLLNLPQSPSGMREDPHHKARLLEQALASFGISAKVTDVVQGPVVTRYELMPAPGVRVNRITNLSDDIALHLAAPRVRIQAPIPGKSVIGIEVPNKTQSLVALREVLGSPDFQSSQSPLSIALGKDISGRLAMTDISKMPHLLIAGSTGSGKSVCINGIICSVIYHASPDDVRLIMVDPKVVELAMFSNLPHLMIPVVTDPKKAAGALRWAVTEMIQRYNAFKKKGARELTRYNDIIMAEGKPKLPKIVIIVDELADLMMVSPDDVEDSICRVAQLGRAAGIHLVIATQRPSADVITGLIKANILSRIAFAVASATDSRIILDCTGAEKLLGKGDMLFSHGGGEPKRIQGALVTDSEVEKIHDYFEELGNGGAFDEAAAAAVDSNKISAGDGENPDDDLLPEAVEVLLTTGQASISNLQRRMRIGYNRAARLIDLMEERGIVSGYEGSKPRKLLITRTDFEELFGREPNIPDVGS